MSIDFTTVLKPEYRWPKQGDRLLRGASHWRSAFEFADDGVMRHALMWDGYIKAGHVLLAAAAQGPFDRNVLIYPALFNYRHGLELAMKWIIARYGHFSNADANDAEGTHDLRKLWGACRAIVEESDDRDRDGIDAVERVVMDFHELDASAESLRFATKKSGKAILLRPGLFDLDNIRDVIEGVANFFAGADGLLADYTSAMPTPEWG